MKKITLVTANRAEYGILRPLIYQLKKEKRFRLQVVVTGSHLEGKHGNTQKEITNDGIKIYKKIRILGVGNESSDTSFTIANALCKFAEYFKTEKPDLLIVLGDRTELMGICCAAMNEHIPIAHLHGGEVTGGMLDESVRHCITKMSYLHFAANEEYRNRIIQMGEDPERVFNVGALGVENIRKVQLLSYEAICSQIEIPLNKKYVVATFHPVTLEEGTTFKSTQALIQAMREKDEYFYLITSSNPDAGGDIINAMLEVFVNERENAKLVASLGMVRYLSAIKYSEFVLGNSSSGIIEAPAMGVPVVNVGERQKGRMMAETIISCGNKKEEIIAAMEEAAKIEHKVSDLYGDGCTSEKIVDILEDFLLNDKIDLKKEFYDLES